MLPALSNLFWRMFQGTSAFEKLHLRVPSSHMPIIKHTRIQFPNIKRPIATDTSHFLGAFSSSKGEETSG